MPERRRNPPARYPLPIDVDPSTRICFKVEVPNDIYHVAAFLGQIRALGRAYAWGDDTAHTARLVAAVWLEIFNNLKPGCDCPPLGGADTGEELLIRQNPDNPCLLETSINGTDWCAFADLSLCIPAGGQPGSGSEQPAPGGGQACYHARLQGSGKWLLPYQVSTGDVITISGASGAVNDGSGIWYCPNGQTFFLGGCVGLFTHDGADPSATAPHGSLIAVIDGVAYPAYNTSITVPAGVSYANVELQVNDGTLSDNYGEWTFDACIENNTAATFTHTFDFTVTDGGFVLATSPGSNNGVYIPGSYWGSTCSLSGGAYYTGVAIKVALAARTITAIQYEYDAALGTGNVQSFATYLNGTLQDNASPPTFGTGKTRSFSGSYAAITEIAFALNSDAWADNSRCNTGYVHLKSVTVSGLGSDPFV